MRVILVGLGIALALGACGGNSVSQGTVVSTIAAEVSTAASISATMAAPAAGTPPATATRPAPSPPPTAVPTRTPSPTATSEPVAKVGDKLSLKGIGTVQVYAVQRPATSTNQFIKPKDGNEFTALDTEICADPALAAGTAIDTSPGNFVLVMADNTRREFAIAAVEPALHATKLLSKDCVRGWVTFEIPQGAAVKQIIFNGYDASFKAYMARWDVPAS